MLSFCSIYLSLLCAGSIQQKKMTREANKSARVEDELDHLIHFVQCNHLDNEAVLLNGQMVLIIQITRPDAQSWILNPDTWLFGCKFLDKWEKKWHLRLGFSTNAGIIGRKVVF